MSGENRKRRGAALITRREMLSGVGAGALLLASANVTVRPSRAQTRQVVRREIMTMMLQHEREFNLYTDAVRRMRARGEWNFNDPTSWAMAGDFHAANCAGRGANISQSSGGRVNDVHGGPHFLPWHRAYLRAMEQRLHQIADDDSFGIPYWDWRRRGREFPAAFTGDFSNPLYRTGRVYGRGSRLPHWDIGYNRGYQAFDYGRFSNTLEMGAHGSVHADVGGDMGRLATAGFDPVFYSHHGNLDRIWESWRQDPTRRSTEPFGLIASTLYRFTDINGAPLNYMGFDLLDMGRQGVMYDFLDPRPGMTNVDTLNPDMVPPSVANNAGGSATRPFNTANNNTNTTPAPGGGSSNSGGEIWFNFNFESASDDSVTNFSPLEAFARSAPRIAQRAERVTDAVKSAADPLQLEAADGPPQTAIVRIAGLRVRGDAARGLVFLAAKEGDMTGDPVFAGHFTLLGNGDLRQSVDVEVDVSTALNELGLDTDEVEVIVTPPPARGGLSTQAKRPLAFDALTLEAAAG